MTWGPSWVGVPVKRTSQTNIVLLKATQYSQLKNVVTGKGKQNIRNK